MPTNYYQLLEISENASSEEIRQAYAIHLKKWQQLREQQPDHLKERTNKVIAYVEKAYQVLSDPTQRAKYNQTLKQDTANNTINKSINQSTNIPDINQAPTNKGLYIIIIILLMLIAIGIFYLIYKANFPPNDQSLPRATVKQTKVDHTSISIELNKALEKAEQLRKQNAQDPTLKVLAKNIAENSNKNLNAIINYNTKFIGAQAANQNITFRFLVIDGISYSQAILSAYLTERFIADNNEVCNGQQTDLAKGILYTFAYYDNKGKLLGSYYIDQQVCQSPASSRIIKRPDINQLEAKEMSATTNQK